MAPKYAIVPVGFRFFPHRTSAALNRINNTGAITYRNDLDYHVEVRCDSSGNYEITRWYAWDSIYTSNAKLVFPAPPLVTGLTVQAETVDHMVLGWNATTGGDKYLVNRSRWSGGDDGAGRTVQPRMGAPTGI